MSFSFGLILARQIIHLDGGVGLVPGRKKETLTIRKFFVGYKLLKNKKSAVDVVVLVGDLLLVLVGVDCDLRC